MTINDEYDAFRVGTPLRVSKPDGSVFDAWYVEGNRAGWHCVRDIRGDWHNVRLSQISDLDAVKLTRARDAEGAARVPDNEDLRGDRR